MLSMSTVTALFDGNRAEAREVFEGMRTAFYISPDDIESKPRTKRNRRYYFKHKGSKCA